MALAARGPPRSPRRWRSSSRSSPASRRPAWFDRAKDGLTSPALPENLLGLLTLLIVPVQILLIAVAMVAFNQNWHVEEERPIGGADPDFDD